MSRQCSEIVLFLNQIYSPDLKEAYDNVGLLLGDTSTCVEKVMVCLDITEEVIQEAVNAHCIMIISHHPILFNGIKSIPYDRKPASGLVRIIREGLQIFALHTNFDNAQAGMNDLLAQKLGLSSIEPLCGNTGRFGELPQEMSLKQFGTYVKGRLMADAVKVAGNPDRKIRRVGVVGGAGADFIQAAVEQQCDVYITGDLKHHEALDALDKGIALIDASHYFTEKIFIEHIVGILNQFGGIEAIASKVNTNPFWVL